MYEYTKYMDIYIYKIYVWGERSIVSFLGLILIFYNNYKVIV